MDYTNSTKEELISRLDMLEKEILNIKESADITFDQAGVGIAHISKEGEFIRVNKMFVQIFGFNSRTMIGMQVHDISYPGEIDLYTPEVQKVWLGELDQISIEKRYVRKDKSVFWGSLTLSRSQSSNEEQIHYIAVLQDLSKRVKAEEYLRISEEKHSSVVENSNDGIAIHKNGRIVFANKAAKNELDYPDNELIGKSIFEIVAPAFQEEVLKRTHARSIGGNAPEITEIEMQRKDGTLFPVEVNTSVIKHEGENSYLVFIRNITKRIKTDNELKESEERFRLLSSLTKEGVVIHRDGFALEVNEAFCKIFGYRIEEIIGTNPMKEMFSPANQQKLLETFKADNTPPHELEGIKKDGSIIMLSVEGRSIVYKGERVRVGTIRDITNQKKTEEALSIKDKAIESSINAIGIADLDGNMIYINQSGVDFWGYSSKKEIIGKSIGEFWHKEHIDSQFRELKEKGFSNNEGIGIKKDGSSFHVQYSVHIVKDTNGKPEQIFGSFIDITEKKKADEALQFEQYLLLSLMDNSPDAIYFKDLNSKFIRINESLAAKFGLNDPKDAVGKSDMDFFIDQHGENAYQDEKEIIKTGRPIINKEEKETWHNGKITYSLTSKLPLHDADGNITGTFGISREISEQKKAEKALRESEEKFKLIFESTPDSIILINLEGKLLEGNRAAEKMLGIKGKNVLGKSLLELSILAEEDLSRAQMQMIQSAMGKPTDPDEYTWIRTDGTRMQVEVRTFPVTINEEPMILAISRDITDRKKAEKELKEHRENLEELVKNRTAKLEESLKENLKLTTAIEQTHATIVITDKEGNIEYVNENFARTTGYSSEETLNQNPRILKSGEHPVSHYVGLWKTIASGKIWKGELINRKKNGELFWESCIITPVINSQEDITHYVAVKEDITERKKVEEELRQFKQFADTSIEGFGMAELDSRILYQNRRLCDLCKIDHPAVNESFLQFYPKEAQKTLQKEVFPELMEKGAWRGELDHLDGEGGTFPTIHNFFVIKDDSGKPMRLAATITDITERKKIELELNHSKEQAEEASRTKSAFLANMSHEIRTPMNSILGFSEMLSSKIEDPKHISYLNSIRSSGKNLLTLINDILDLSKVEAGAIEINSQLIQTRVFFSEIEDIFLAYAKEKNLEFHLSIEDDIPPGIYLDELRIRQILTNLLGNAVKFTDTGSVRLSVQQKIKKENDVLKTKEQFIDLIIRIEDTGIGISESFLPNLFKTFQQEDNEITRRFGGTGLGLSISKRLAEMMNGDILVESTLHKGSIFTLYLKNVKLAYDVKEHTPEKIFRTDPVIFPSHSILIADDNSEIRKFFAEVFSETNLKIALVSNGKEAFEHAIKAKPHLIITDIKMPVMDGYELNERLKKHPDLKGIPVIAVSASAMKEEIEKIRQCKFEGILSKPVSYNELMIEVQKYIKPRKSAKKSIVDQEQSEYQLTDEVRKTLPGIIKIIEKEWMADWERLKKKPPMDEVESFGIKVRAGGEEYQIEFIAHFGMQLIQAVQSFDIEQIRKLIKEFPHIIEKMKKLQ